MIEFATGPRPKKKPKPKKILTIGNEEVFYDFDLDLYEFAVTPIQVFGWSDSDGFLLLADQEIILYNNQTMTITNGFVSSIS